MNPESMNKTTGGAARRRENPPRLVSETARCRRRPQEEIGGDSGSRWSPGGGRKPTTEDAGSIQAGWSLMARCIRKEVLLPLEGVLVHRVLQGRYLPGQGSGFNPPPPPSRMWGSLVISPRRLTALGPATFQRA